MARQETEETFSDLTNHICMNIWIPLCSYLFHIINQGVSVLLHTRPWHPVTDLGSYPTEEPVIRRQPPGRLSTLHYVSVLDTVS